MKNLTKARIDRLIDKFEAAALEVGNISALHPDDHEDAAKSYLASKERLIAALEKAIEPAIDLAEVNDGREMRAFINWSANIDWSNRARQDILRSAWEAAINYTRRRAVGTGGTTYPERDQ